jgi:pantothenate synthetase
LPSRTWKAGSQFLAEDLAEELARKKSEVAELRKVADSIHKLSDTGDWETPVEISYCHTVREGDGLGTRTTAVTLADAGEANDAASAIEKKLDSWEKLRDQMLEDLKKKQRKVAEMESSIPDFAESSREMVDDVLAILH